MGRLSLCVLVFMSVVALVLSDTAAAPAAATAPAAAAAPPAVPAAAGAPVAPAAAGAPAPPAAAAVPAQPPNMMSGAIKLVTSVPKGMVTMCKDVADAIREIFSFGK